MSSTTAAKLSKIRQFKDIPGPPRIPIWGTLYLYKLGMYKVEEYHNVLFDMFKKYGPLVREDLGPNNTIIHVFDPADAKTVFANEGPMPAVEPLQETTQLYRKIKNTSPGLGNTNGQEWYKLRSAVRKVLLRPKEIQKYLPEINQITDDFITRLHQRGKDSAYEIPYLRLEIGKWSREVSGWVCFGKRLGCLDKGKNEKEAAKIIQLNEKGFKLSSQLKFSLPIYRLFTTPKWKDLVQVEDVVHKYAVDLVESSIRDYQMGKGGPECFLSYLILQDLTPKEVEILVLSIFGDGLSTTVPSLIYNLYCLSINPDLQEQMREEVRAATDENQYISVDIINKLQLLKAFVKETFRIYPIGTEISRIIPKDLLLSNYHVPKGTHVHLNQIVQYRSDHYFNQPEKFQPERWLRGGCEKLDPVLLVPFGHGTRSCAGRRFAEQDLYVFLSKLLLNFELQYPENLPPLKQVYEVLLFPREPIGIKFKPLKSKSTMKSNVSAN